MRRSIIFAGLLILLLSFCGCTKQDKPHLDMSNYGEEFRAENENLFPNTSCEHPIIYKDASSILSPEEAQFYHITTCKYGNCDYEEHYEPHFLRWYIGFHSDGKGFPTYDDNGYLYHKLNKQCVECNVYLTFYVYCEKQDINCGRLITDALYDSDDYTECLAADRDWEEIFKDFPYKIKVEIW